MSRACSASLLHNKVNDAHLTTVSFVCFQPPHVVEALCFRAARPCVSAFVHDISQTADGNFTKFGAFRDKDELIRF